MQAGMYNDMRLYAKALNTAAYIYNIFPSTTMNNVSPYEDLHGQPWERGYGHLRPFGCYCLVHVLDAERQHQSNSSQYADGSGKRLPASMMPRSRPALFLGYAHHAVHVWKVIDLHTLQTGIYCDITFDQECFPTLPALPIRLSELYKAKQGIPISEQTGMDERTNASLRVPPPAAPSSLVASVKHRKLNLTDGHECRTECHHSMGIPGDTPLLSSNWDGDWRRGMDAGTPSIMSRINKSQNMALVAYSLASQALCDRSTPSPILHINWALHTIDGLAPRRRLRYDEYGDPLNLYTAQAADWNNWRNAVMEEWESHKQNGTFELVRQDQMPPESSIISSKWVFKKKTLSNGSRYKARLVIRGFLQQDGIDYETTYAPTASLTTLRLLIALAVYFGWSLWNIDFITAFLNGHVQENIYMSFPEGLEGLLGLPPGQYNLKLIKALYGLRQAPRIWWKVINDYLLSLGFHCCADADVNLYTLGKDDQFVAILLFVDDMLFAGNHHLILQIVQQLSSQFRLRDLGEPDLFLGIQLKRQSTGILLHQERYTQKILERFQMADAKPMPTPLPPKTIHTSESNEILLLSPEKAARYRSIIGALMYLVVCTRPDLAFTLSRLSKFSAKPAKKHLSAAEHCLRYLAGTRHHGIFYLSSRYITPKTIPLLGYSDSAFADDLENRRSTSAFIFLINGAAVSWKSKQQSLVSRSTHDAEYIALANASYEVSWLRRLVSAFLSTVDAINLHGDNQSAIITAHSPPDAASSPRTKHIDIRFHIIREAIQRGDIKLTYIRTENMVADCLTKALPAPIHNKHCQHMGLQSPDSF